MSTNSVHSLAPSPFAPAPYPAADSPHDPVALDPPSPLQSQPPDEATHSALSNSRPSSSGLGLGLGLMTETIGGHSHLIQDLDGGGVHSVAGTTSPTSTRLSGGDFPLGREAPAQLSTSPASVFSSAGGLGPAPIESRSSTPASSTVRSPRPSESSGVQSSNSSINIPAEPAVDLSLPNRPVTGSGVYVSVANSPLARLAADNGAVTIGARPRSHSGGPRAFLSALLSRSPRSPSGSPTLSPQSSPRLGQARSPQNQQGTFGSPLASFRQRDAHSRTNSMPPSSDPATQQFESAQATLFGTVPPPLATDRSDAESSHSAQVRRTPRSIAAATFAGLARASSLRSPSMASSPSMPTVNQHPPSFVNATRAGAMPRSASAPISPAVTIGFATPGPDRGPTAAPPSLTDIGLTLAPLTPSMGLGRNAQPLCGAILDNKYLLIGTNTGLDFLPLPMPGSFPMRTHGRKRKETRKPIALIKRTRFKELAVLSERSNILLAIAGRNDHVRVYALDGIRAMIERKMHDLDARDGYPFVPSGASATQAASSSAPHKGKAKAEPFVPSATRPQSTFPRPGSSRGQSSASASAQPGPYHFPAASPPPDYSIAAPSPSLRRRMPSAYGQGGLISPASPARTTTGSIVRAVPTNLGSSGLVGPASPRTLRAQKSREFVASRRGSGAVLPRRKSRVDVNEASLSRRGSVASSVDRTRSPPAPPLPSLEQVTVKAGTLSLLPPTPPAPGNGLLSAYNPAQRRASVASSVGGESSWHTSVGGSPNPDRLEPRREEPIVSRRASATADLALFLRQSGPAESEPSPRTMRAKSMGDEIRSFLPSSLGRSATSPALQGENAPSPSGSLTEFLRHNGADGPAGRRHSAALSHLSSSGSSLPKLTSRAPTSPKLIRTERSPTAELIDMLRETGPDDALPRRGSGRALPREPSSPALKSHEMSPEMEMAGLMRGTGPESIGAGSGMSRTASSLAPGWNRSFNGSESGLPLLGTAPSEDGGDSRRSSLAENGFDPAAARAAMAAQATANGSTLSVNAPVRPGLGRTLSAQRRLIARSPITQSMPPEGSETESSPEVEGSPAFPDRRKSLTLSQMMRNGPPPGASLGGAVPSSHSTGSLVEPALAGSPPSRSKRWTMTVGSMLGASRQSSNSPTGAAANGPLSSPRRASSDARRVSMDRPQPVVTQAGPATQPPSEARRPVGGISPSSRASAPVQPSDLKRPAPPLHRPSHAPSVPSSSQVPPDAHPANSASPLEYVKLARTRGARLLRAVETKKRTYLAVLCGDDGERIELFTGSRSISLSLNRTFVLPESPRTIEFQLQGDDLIDVYLVYPESIFALEPATVRVREVGVGRGERRQRRERERRMRDLAASAVAAESATAGAETAGVTEGSAGTEVVRPLEGSLSPAETALHPADPARTEGLPRPLTPETRAVEGMDSLLAAPESDSRSPSPVDSLRPVSATAATPASPARPSPLTAGSSSSVSPAAPVAEVTPDAGRSSPPNGSTPTATQVKPKHALPYTTFQQLPFVPPVPSSVLSSAWTIPPLYTDVVGSGSAASPPPPPHAFNQVPNITQSGELGAGLPAAEDEAPGFAMNENLPLLSPISLLGGTAQRQAGPPGLFFVSKGKNLSGIVTGDGRSVIKRPLVWSLDKASESDADVYEKIEMIIVHPPGGITGVPGATPRTVVVGMGNREVRAIAVGGEAGQAPFGQAVGVAGAGVGVSAREKEKDAGKEREVKWLGTQGGGSQLFFCERVGQNWTVSVLAARS